MTYSELKNLRGIGGLIAYQQSKVTRLEAQVRSAGTSMTGERTPGVSDKVGDGVVALVVAKEELERLKRLEEERNAFVESIADCNVRLAVSLYFIDGKTWRQTAFRLGGKNTKDGVRKMCQRYLA